MKAIKDILYKVSIEAIEGNMSCEIDRITFDSRQVQSKDLYVAIPGVKSDGHDFIAESVKKGARVVVCEFFPSELDETVTYIRVEDSRAALAVMAANFFGRPSENLKLVGVTGTNGKTTVATLLYELFSKAGYKVGLLSTVRILVGDQEYPAAMTTPDSLTINRYLRQMNAEGAEFCFMEVSSHGIDQKRTEGLQFAGGIFTNLSHDHLDYHKTFVAYRDVKKKFFDQLPKAAFALTNLDDKNGAYMVQNTRARHKTYALKSDANYKVKILEDSFQGMLLSLNGAEVWTQLIGDFNAYNLAAIYGAAHLLGLDEKDILVGISGLIAVEGRFEYVVSTRDKITAIVDYAHTPDALKNVLLTVNAIRTHRERLFTVVGCGGDRDKTKRPEMGRIAVELSDQVILTSDNPRTEDPVKIIEDIEKGIPSKYADKTLSIVDRKQAIKTACTLAKQGDIILIAGKGHETYQEVHGKRHHFDDMEIITDYFKILAK